MCMGFEMKVCMLVADGSEGMELLVVMGIANSMATKICVLKNVF